MRQALVELFASILGVKVIVSYPEMETMVAIITETSVLEIMKRNAVFAGLIT